MDYKGPENGMEISRGGDDGLEGLRGGSMAGRKGSMGRGEGMARGDGGST